VRDSASRTDPSIQAVNYFTALSVHSIHNPDSVHGRKEGSGGSAMPNPDRARDARKASLNLAAISVPNAIDVPELITDEVTAAENTATKQHAVVAANIAAKSAGLLLRLRGIRCAALS